MTSMDQNPTSKIRMRYLLATVMAMLLVLGATAGMPHGGMPMGGTPAGAPADPDEAFIEMMIPHHQGAVAMIGRFLDTTKRPELQQLARNIIRSQEREIAQMESWKRSWGAGSK